MSHAKRILLLTLAPSLLLAGIAAAQLPGQVFGQIFDENEEPVQGVLIIVTDPERPDFRQEETSDKRGRYRIRLTNATVPYNVTLQKDGYAPLNLTGIRVPARQETRRNITMRTAQAMLTADQAAAAQAAPTEADLEEAEKGSAITVYNEGVKALNSGDPEMAKELFLTALERNAELPQALSALARAHHDLDEHRDAVEWANKALALSQEPDSMNQILYASYSALGDEKMAEEALARLKEADPEKASLNMFNEAADLFNAGALVEAQTAFEAILETSPDHAKSHYMLGLCYVNAGENGKAKEHFARFLELAPDDPDAGTAAEMVKYLE